VAAVLVFVLAWQQPLLAAAAVPAAYYTSEPALDYAPCIAPRAGNSAASIFVEGATWLAAYVNRPMSCEADEAGVLYITCGYNNNAWRAYLNGTVYTLVNTARSSGTTGDGGDARGARLNGPTSGTLWNGSYWIADRGNNRVRRVVLATNIITTAFGTTQPNGMSFGVLAGAPTMFIATGSHSIMSVDMSAPSPSAVVLAGTGSSTPFADNRAAALATFYDPDAVTWNNGTLLVADKTNHRVRQIAWNASGAFVTTVAGTGLTPALADGLPATSTNMKEPSSVAIALDSTMYISEISGYFIRRIVTPAVTIRIAGTGSYATALRGYIGPATAAVLNNPTRLSFDRSGALLDADSDSDAIRAIDNRVCVTGNAVSSGWQLLNFSSNSSSGGGSGRSSVTAILALQPYGVVPCLWNASQLESMTPAQAAAAAGYSFSLALGVPPTFVYFEPCATVEAWMHAATQVPLCQMYAMIRCNLTAAIDATLPWYLVADLTGVNRTAYPYAPAYISKAIPPVPSAAAGDLCSDTVAGNGTGGFSGDGGWANESTLLAPAGVMADVDGCVYFSDTGNNLVRSVCPGGTLGTVLGGGVGVPYTRERTLASNVTLATPAGMALVPGFVYLLADAGNNVVRRWEPSPNGVIVWTVAGNTSVGYEDTTSGVDARETALRGPQGVGCRNATECMVADTGNHRVRKLTPNSATMVTAVGSGASTPGGASGSTGTTFPIVSPVGVAWDVRRMHYLIAESGGNRIRAYNPESGVVDTLAGSGTAGNGGDGGPATSAALNGSMGIVTNPATGMAYIADTGNARIRAVSTLDHIIRPVASGIVATAIDIDRAGSLYVAEPSQHRIRVLSRGICLAGSATRAALTNVTRQGRVVTGVLALPTLTNLPCFANFATTVSLPARAAAFATAGYTMGLGRAPIAFESATMATVEFPCDTLQLSADLLLMAPSCQRLAAFSCTLPAAVVNASTAYRWALVVALRSADWSAKPTELPLTYPLPGSGAADDPLPVYAPEAAPATEGLPACIAPIAGNGSADAPGTVAGLAAGQAATTLPLPLLRGVAYDTNGTLYVADGKLAVVLAVAGNGTTAVLAGNGTVLTGPPPATAAATTALAKVGALAYDAATASLVVVEETTRTLRRIPAHGGGVMTLLAGNGNTAAPSAVPGTVSWSNATSVPLGTLASVAVAADGTVFFTEDGAVSVVRRLSSVYGMLTHIGGGSMPVAAAATGTPALAANLSAAHGVAVMDDGALAVADVDGAAVYVVRGRLNAAGRSAATRWAGNGSQAWMGWGGGASAARLCQPNDAVPDGRGGVYVADKCGAVFHLTGNGSALAIAGDLSATNNQTPGGDGGVARNATLGKALRLAMDGSGTVAVVDGVANQVRAVDPRICLAPSRTLAPSVTIVSLAAAATNVVAAVAVAPPGAFACLWRTGAGNDVLANTREAAATASGFRFGVGLTPVSGAAASIAFPCTTLRLAVHETQLAPACQQLAQVNCTWGVALGAGGWVFVMLAPHRNGSTSTAVYAPLPLPTPAPTASPSISISSSRSVSNSVLPSASPSKSNSGTPSMPPSESPSGTSSETSTGTITASPTSSISTGASPSESPSLAPTPTRSAAVSASASESPRGTSFVPPGTSSLSASVSPSPLRTASVTTTPTATGSVGASPPPPASLALLVDTTSGGGGGGGSGGPIGAYWVSDDAAPLAVAVVVASCDACALACQGADGVDVVPRRVAAAEVAASGGSVNVAVYLPYNASTRSGPVATCTYLTCSFDGGFAGRQLPLVLGRAQYPFFSDVVVWRPDTSAARSGWGGVVDVGPAMTAACVNMGGVDCGNVTSLLALPAALAAGAVAVAQRPPSADAVFSITLTSGTNVTLVADTARGGIFLPGVNVTFGGVSVTPTWVSAAGDLLHLTLPVVACGATGDCGRQALMVVNPSPADSDAGRAAAAGGVVACNPAGALWRGGQVSCPPWCPNDVTADAEPYVPRGGAAGVPVAAQFRAGAAPVLVPPSATRRSGVFVTTRCTAAGFSDPATGVCTNASHPDARRCAFGAGAECRVCPAHALCPGGYRAWPLPGYTTAREDSGVIVACLPPAGRCAGWDAAAGAGRCGAPFAGGAGGAGAPPPHAAAGGTRRPRPPAPPPRGGGAPCGGPPGGAVGCTVLAVVVVYAAAAVVGGKVTASGDRVVALLSWSFTVMQLVASMSLAAAPSLPSFVAPVYAAINVFAFSGLTLPSSCMPGFAFVNEVSQLGVVLALVVLRAVAEVVESRWSAGTAAVRAAAAAAVAKGDTPAAVSVGFVPKLLRLHAVLLAVMYGPVVNTVVDLLYCRASGGGDEAAAWVMASNPAVTCYTGPHTIAAGVAWATVAAYLVAYPVWSAGWLSCLLRRPLPSPATAARRPSSIVAVLGSATSGKAAAATGDAAAASTTAASRCKQRVCSYRITPAMVARDAAAATRLAFSRTALAFIGTAYRPSAWWYFHADWATLAVLAVIARVARNPGTVGAIAGRTVVVLLILLLLGAGFGVGRPYPATDRWKLVVKLHAVALTAAAALLQAVQQARLLTDPGSDDTAGLVLAVGGLGGALPLFLSPGTGVWVSLLTGAQRGAAAGGGGAGGRGGGARGGRERAGEERAPGVAAPPPPAAVVGIAASDSDDDSGGDDGERWMHNPAARRHASNRGQLVVGNDAAGGGDTVTVEDAAARRTASTRRVSMVQWAGAAPVMVRGSTRAVLKPSQRSKALAAARVATALRSVRRDSSGSDDGAGGGQQRKSVPNPLAAAMPAAAAADPAVSATSPQSPAGAGRPSMLLRGVRRPSVAPGTAARSSGTGASAVGGGGGGGGAAFSAPPVPVGVSDGSKANSLASSLAGFAAPGVAARRRPGTSGARPPPR